MLPFAAPYAVAVGLGGLLICGGLIASIRSRGSDGVAGRRVRLGAGLLFSITLTVGLLELVLRVYSAVSRDPLTLASRIGKAKDIDHADVLRRRKAGQLFFGVPFNSLGFYDTEFERPKPSDVFRIVALADSFGVGTVPYPYNFLTLLEGELAGFAGTKRIEVCNLGVISTWPQHYLVLLEQFGVRLEPDLVLLAFFLGNDFSADAADPSYRSPWDRFLVYRVPARLYRFARADGEPVERRVGDQQPRLIVPDYVHDWRLEKPSLPEDDFLKTELWRTKFFDPARDDSLYVGAMQYMDHIADTARQVTGRPLVTVLIPDELQVNPGLRARLEAMNGVVMDVEKPNRYLHQRLRSSGIEVIDLLPALQAAEARIGRTYHLQNTHWNAAGNRVAAEEIGRQLRLHADALRPQ